MLSFGFGVVAGSVIVFLVLGWVLSRGVWMR